MGWELFWSFVFLFFVVETLLYQEGHDTHFWKHETDAEKRIQELKIKKLEKDLNDENQNH